jgi:DhnA family fructose-bisphosphate aldolase class Ia
MVEPLVMTTNPEGGSSSVSDPEKIATLVRQAVELGADIIKVDPVEPMERFSEVVEIAHPIPVLVRGGGKVTTRELLERTKTAVEVGAKGVVYGRNVVQHPHPASLIAALQAIVHENKSVEEALALVKESA